MAERVGFEPMRINGEGFENKGVSKIPCAISCARWLKDVSEVAGDGSGHVILAVGHDVLINVLQRVF